MIKQIEPNEPSENTFQWIQDRRSHEYPYPKVNLTLCQIYQRGNYIILEYDDKVFFWEHVGVYCYMREALTWFKPELPDEWKTLDQLITFRNAIRECTAQGMGLEDMYMIDNLTYLNFKNFIKKAGDCDYQHHGSITF